MPPLVIALLAAASIGTWVYNKSMSRTGNNTSSSLRLAGVSGVIAFVVTLTILSFINSALEG